jgi:two-component system, LytTR family, response regulator
MKAIIVDDEPQCIESLCAKIDLFVPELKIIKTYVLPQEALREIHKLDIDLVFLDIEMPNVNGISFAQRANLVDTDIIFTTAHQKYAIDAFRVSAFDFLLKPIDRHELKKSIDRLGHKIAEKGKAKISRLHARYNKITVNTSKGMLFVPMESILWLQADNNYTTLHLASGQPIVTSRPIGDFEDQLAAFDFFRVHQSAMINIQHLQSYNKGEGGSVTLSNGTEIEVSRRRKADLMAMIG